MTKIILAYNVSLLAQASSHSERAWAVVLTRAPTGLRISHTPLNYFAGCAGLLAKFSFTIKLVANCKCNFANVVKTQRCELVFDTTSFS